ncbi:MAG: heme exporter protein CcmB, partial [Legionellaceae bacterium]
MKQTNVFQRLCWREFILIKRQYRVILNTCLFFMMVMAFFPLAFPADPALLRMILPGLVWTAVLFAVFLSSERLFQQEVDEGVLEQWLLSNLC